MMYLRSEADCLAWPWVSTAEFSAASHCFDPKRAQGPLAERLKAHGDSEATQEYLKALWRPNEPLLARVRRLAGDTLQRADGGWRLITDHALPGRELLRWRYISLVLPPGMLVAAATGPGVIPQMGVTLLDGGFAPTGPVAHLHLHSGAAYTFEVVWSHVMSRRDHLLLKKDPKLPPGFTEQTWREWLVRARLARRVLRALTRRAGTSIVEAVDAVVDPDERSLAEDALDELAEGSLRHVTGVGRALVARMANRVFRYWREPRTLADVWTNDPLGSGDPWPEGAMLSDMFTRLAPSSGEDWLERLFVQYLRMRCLLFWILVHDHTNRGLDSFVHSFRQFSPYRKGLDLVVSESAFTEPGIDLRAVEVRTEPPERVTAVRELADALEGCARRTGKEAGWVFHFIRDTGTDNGKTTGEEMRKSYASMRAASWRLCKALQLHPRLLRTIRGVDIAGSERKGPLWLAVPLFKELRALSHRLAGEDRPGLRAMIHVGEDFRHLASGLRAIHEPIAWQVVERGDRFGHALALGVDPDRWCDRHPRVLLPRWERICDLAWMLGAFADDRTGLRVQGDDCGAALLRLRGELTEHLRVLGHQGTSDDAIELWYSLFGAAETLPRLLDAGQAAQHVGPLALLHLRLFGSSKLQALLDAPCAVDPSIERPVLRALSRALRALVGLWQFVIEVNPTSNLLIAGFEAPLEQPIFVLHPLEPDQAALPITVNTDDPLMFSTCLADEFAYAWAALVLAGGVQPGYARQWLTEVAATSYRARFTLPLPPVD